MKKIAMLMAAIMIIQNVSYAFSTRSIIVKSTKVIPFSFVSNDQHLEEDISIKGLKNANIERVYVDNGELNYNINGNYIEVDFDNGEWSNSYKTISKVKTLELDNVVLLDEDTRKIVITPDDTVKSIQDVTGDFSSAKVLDNGDVEITVDEGAKGFLAYDENSIVKSQFTVNIDENNMNREIESKALILPHEIVGDIKPKSGDTSAVKEIYLNGNEVSVLFANGIPKENEIVTTSGYTYFWIDRDEQGRFRKYNPNSVYSTDINKITGVGEYLTEDEFDEIGMSFSNDKWLDYCGIEKDGVRYIYVYDESKGIPKAFEGRLVENNEIVFSNQDLNSEKLIVRFSNADVSYIPEGKLYSMGELVSNTKGWGEVVPNKENESTKTFFNELTGKLETYVKHFKFFYGPKEKKTFGGYYTYPYSCVFEYQHYKPITCYSGEVSYEYESTEKIKGYSYNGWIRIIYEEEKNINDYPPTPPINVKYDALTGKITWNNGSDDYTKISDLKYEVQIYDGEWKTIENKPFLELIVLYKINYNDPDVRIRTVDEINQVSDWAYASESQIELSGNLTPYIVKPGDRIDIFATTKSLEKIQNVIAKNEELNMCIELPNSDETISEFFEMSYDVEADFPEEEDEFLIITNGRAAFSEKEEIDSFSFRVNDEFDKGYLDFNICKDIKFKQDGTLIFSNHNYDDIPLDMFNFDSKSWFYYFINSIYVKNKITGKRERFFEITADTKLTGSAYRAHNIPDYKITINNFDYDESGNPTYKTISVDKTLMSKPISITWNTDAQQITTFNVYMDKELIHTYLANWNEISKHVDNFDSIYMYKKVKRFSLASYGYINPGSKIQASWNKIACTILPGYDLRKFPWLGYRVRNNEYLKKAYVEEYNANPNVRNNYRLMISDKELSNEAIKRYIDILKVKNITMTRDEETLFGDDTREYTSTFRGIDIPIVESTKPGSYEIDLVATDIGGNIAETKLNLVVQSDVNEENKEEQEEIQDIEKEPIIIENYFGRFFYRDEKGYLEELKQTEKNLENNGFICAGETLGFSLITKAVDYLEVDFIGDSSIKTLDSLTQKFLIDIPLENGKDTEEIKYQYLGFPKKIYPQYVDNNEMQVFKWFYTIPYKTNQSLESWSSLKNSTLENIDTSKLFDRKIDPYELVIYLNGDRENGIHLCFDVFERWDTILNRDVTKYIINSDTRWEMRIDK